jgi:hypothetical protein
MFSVRGDKVYPLYDSWTPSVSGLTVEDLVNRLETYLSHTPFPTPIGPSIEASYGLKANLTSAAKQWGNPWTTSLLQPTWLPEGMNQTAVYVQNSNVTSHTGAITQVTILDSREGIDDPTTAEIQLRVLMSWDMGWMDPHPDMDLGIEGNYTTINGYPAYIGLIGWFDGGYYYLYGGSARVVSMRVGYVLYIFRAPENIPISDLVKMASSLKPV